MIPFLLTAAALSMLFGPPHLAKKQPPPCPADTVTIRLHYHEDNLFPYVISDTTNVSAWRARVRKALDDADSTFRMGPYDGDFDQP